MTPAPAKRFSRTARRADVGSQVVHAYLSRQHYQNVEDSCPMVALPNDVARSGATHAPRSRTSSEGGEKSDHDRGVGDNHDSSDQEGVP
jgi:hypothetical protein